MASQPCLPNTAALDGLRGLAAVIIFNFHIMFAYSPLVEYGFGVDGQNKRWIQLPVIRLLHSGHAMVVVFFVVGGYVASIRYLKMIQRGSQPTMRDIIGSFLARRFARLYIPAITLSFISMLTVYAGFWELPRQYIADKRYIYYADYHPVRRETIYAQFFHWLKETTGLMAVFTYFNDGNVMPYYNEYDPHLWTVPFEYRGGLVLAALLMAFARCAMGRTRLWIGIGSIMLCILLGRWELVCFLSGSLLCAMHMARGNSSSTHADNELHQLERLDIGQDSALLPTHLPAGDEAEKQHDLLPQFSLSINRNSPRILNPLLFLLSLFLLSTPNLLIELTPFYSPLSYLIPPTYTDPKRFPHTLGALLLVHCVLRVPALTWLLTTAPMRYLGRRSYSIYLVHGPVIHVLGYAMQIDVWRWAGVDARTGPRAVYWLCLVLSTVVLAVVVLGLAEGFWRLVDSRVVGLVRGKRKGGRG